MPVRLARKDDQLTDALARVGARVQELRVAVHHPLIDAEEVDPPGIGVGARLEHVGKELAVILGRERHLRQLEAAVLHRRGQILDDRVEQSVGPEVPRRDAAYDGEDRAVVGAASQRVDDFGVRDR